MSSSKNKILSDENQRSNKSKHQMDIILNHLLSLKMRLIVFKNYTFNLSQTFSHVLFIHWGKAQDLAIRQISLVLHTGIVISCKDTQLGKHLSLLLILFSLPKSEHMNTNNIEYENQY